MPLPQDFLSMLTTDALWHQRIASDQWGNESWADPVPIKCYMSAQGISFGSQDGHQKQDGTEVITGSVITDAIGARLRDGITVAGVIHYVVGIDTPKDERGIDLMHTLSVTTELKG